MGLLVVFKWFLDGFWHEIWDLLMVFGCCIWQKLFLRVFRMSSKVFRFSKVFGVSKGIFYGFSTDLVAFRLVLGCFRVTFSPGFKMCSG